LIPGSREITKGIWWGGDFSTVINLLKEDALEPSRLRFFLGYSGWEQGQLNEELQQNTWLITKAKTSLVFYKKPQEIWSETIKSMGDDYAMMVNFPIDPQLN
jgi:putative transcriptional regulator